MSDVEDLPGHDDDSSVRVRAVAIKQEPAASPCYDSTCSQYGGVPRSWLEDFPWLEFTDDEHGGVCKVCVGTGQDGRLSSTEHHDLLSHAWSIVHQEAEALRDRGLRTLREPCTLQAQSGCGMRQRKNLAKHSLTATNTCQSPESRSHRYEQHHRVRKFCKHWLTIYTWLTYDAQENIMYCKYCRKQKIGNNSFVQGSRCFKRDTLRAHDLCKEHRLAMNAESLSTAISHRTDAIPSLTGKANFLLHKLLKYFPWLVYNAETRVLICDTCQRHSVNTLYVDCSYRLDHQVIQQHLESKRHQMALAAEFRSWHVMYDMATEQGEGDLQLEEISQQAAAGLTQEVLLGTPSSEPFCVESSDSFSGIDSSGSEILSMTTDPLEIHDTALISESNTGHGITMENTNECNKNDSENPRPRFGLCSRPVLKNNVKGKIQPTFGRFKPEWKKEFAWLYYDNDQNVMVCMLCRKHKKKNTFVRGIRVFLRSFITHHVKSVKHRKAAEEEAIHDPDSYLLTFGHSRQPLSRLPTSSDQVPLVHRIPSAMSGFMEDAPDDIFTTDPLRRDADGWHVTLSGHQRALMNGVMDDDPSHDDVIDTFSHDSNEYRDHVMSSVPYDDESVSGGMVVLERKKDGTMYRRVRKFRPHWLKDFPWLLYSRPEDVMRCAVCMKHHRSSAFTKGTRTFHLDNIKKHEGSSNHQRAMGLEIA